MFANPARGCYNDRELPHRPCRAAGKHRAGKGQKWHMAELKQVIASNLIELRTKAGMKQADLAAQINYSDKSVSKWERGEAVPDVAVLKSIADIFGVSLDYLVSTHDEWEDKSIQARQKQAETGGTINFRMISCVAIMGIWALALLLFIIFWLRGSLIWLIFLGAVPVSLITLLVPNSVWNGGRKNRFIIAALVLSIIGTVYLTFLSRNLWQLWLLAIPSLLLVSLGARIYRSAQKH